MFGQHCILRGLSSAKAQVTFFEVDGKVVATQQVARTVPLILQWDETFDTQQAKLPQSQEAKWSVWSSHGHF
jgi:hypothetical protein